MLQKPCRDTPIRAATSSDSDLISAMMAGEHSAFSELMSRYKTPLYRFILRYTGASPDAEDILQETFLSIYSKAASYNPAWKASTWIYRIALNKTRDHARKQRLRKFAPLDRKPAPDTLLSATEPADPGPDVEQVVIHRDELRHLALALQNLPHGMRSAVVLHLIEGRSQSECAEILGITRKSVEILVYRARKALRRTLGVDCRRADADHPGTIQLKPAMSGSLR